MRHFLDVPSSYDPPIDSSKRRCGMFHTFEHLRLKLLLFLPVMPPSHPQKLNHQPMPSLPRLTELRERSLREFPQETWSCPPRPSRPSMAPAVPHHASSSLRLEPKPLAVRTCQPGPGPTPLCVPRARTGLSACRHGSFFTDNSVGTRGFALRVGFSLAEWQPA